MWFTSSFVSSTTEARTLTTFWRQGSRRSGEPEIGPTMGTSRLATRSVTAVTVLSPTLPGYVC